MGDYALSVAVMAVPERAASVRRLLHALGPAPAEVTGIQVVWDRGHTGAAANGRRAWLACPPRATHHLILQDDVVVARDLLAACQLLVAARPEHFITLFCSRGLIGQARMDGTSWARLRMPLMAQGYLVPRAWTHAYCTWEARHVKSELNSYDARVCMWLDALDRDAWATVPSLVDHQDGGVSVMKHPNAPGGRQRVAHWFIGADQSALSVDWSRVDQAPYDSHRPGADYQRWLRT